ncbi:MAG TPA: glycerol kinase GlpK [Candidatus Limnocylindria bacterium]|nr:glycerol kinase GlpK [Candidatus Limnocylindria bacterium]
MKDPLVLAIDQGTTGTTVLLIDRQGRVRGRGYAELLQHFPRPGWVEHDGDEIWAGVLAAIHKALLSVRGAAARVVAIGITNQRETALVWDRKSGRPAARAIVWQDRRTSDRCAALQRRGLEPEIRRRTGLRLDPYFSATKVAWLLVHGSGLRARARRGQLAFGTVDSWVLWKLTGGHVHATDPTNASRTLLYHIGEHRWDERLLDVFGVPANLLPRVLPSSGEFGRTLGVRGLPDGIPIAGMAGDQQAALFGQGCVTSGQSKNTYGTGCFLLLHTGARRVASRAGLLTTVACGPRGEPAYALEGSVFIAGAALQWLRDGLGLLRHAADSEAIARRVSDSGGVVMVPAFVGLGAPYWRPDVRGALFGLTRGTRREHIVRAALEALAFQTRDLAEAMARDAGRRLRVLRVDGGAAANDFLMQWQADLLGVPVERPRVIETTALGAGLLAGLAVGLWSSHRDLDRARKLERVFVPRQGRAWREAEYARWKRAVAALLASRG